MLLSAVSRRFCLVLDLRGGLGGLGWKTGSACDKFEDMKVVYWVSVSESSGNNNNSETVFMVLLSWQSYCESSPGSFDKFGECRMVPSSRPPSDQAKRLGL